MFWMVLCTSYSLKIIFQYKNPQTWLCVDINWSIDVKYSFNILCGDLTA